MPIPTAVNTEYRHLGSRNVSAPNFRFANFRSGHFRVAQEFSLHKPSVRAIFRSSQTFSLHKLSVRAIFQSSQTFSSRKLSVRAIFRSAQTFSSHKLSVRAIFRDSSERSPLSRMVERYYNFNARGNPSPASMDSSRTREPTTRANGPAYSPGPLAIEPAGQRDEGTSRQHQQGDVRASLLQHEASPADPERLPYALARRALPPR